MSTRYEASPSRTAKTSGRWRASQSFTSEKSRILKADGSQLIA
jgi:hypothetical protein